MSKYRYLSVEACFPTWFSADITLPDKWDEMSKDERIAYIKDAAEQQMLGNVADNTYEYGKQFRHLSISNLEQWSVSANALEHVASKPLVQLVLDGSYNYMDHIDWDDNDNF